MPDGPVPWASKSNLTFIAEQVSHHPPISAFYAEHVEKRIMCSGISKISTQRVVLTTFNFSSHLDKKQILGTEYWCK